jgi:hypothetical protein
VAGITEEEIADAFVLEQMFPSAAETLDGHTPVSTANDDVLVALDTNALLLPYEIKAGNLKALKDVYDQLSKKDRLHLPDRVVREFVKNRDAKLAEIIKALEDRKSRELPASDMPPILESLPAFSEATKGRDQLSEAREQYTKAIDELIAEMKGWRPMTRSSRCIRKF